MAGPEEGPTAPQRWCRAAIGGGPAAAAKSQQRLPPREPSYQGHPRPSRGRVGPGTERPSSWPQSPTGWRPASLGGRRQE